MSLYFEEEAVKEIVPDPEKDKITFTFPWIVNIPQLSEDSEGLDIITKQSLRTSFNVYSTKWDLYFSKNLFQIQNGQLTGSSFFITYKLFSDNEMLNEIFSSPRILVSNSPGRYYLSTPEGAMKEFADAFTQRKLAKVVIFVEFVLPKKYFDRPFDFFQFWYWEDKCNKLPTDMESDFRFEFLKESDFSIVCSDGIVTALKRVLFLMPSIVQTYIIESKTGEFVVDHCVDVIKPVITYLQSLCFQMPQFYDLDYVERILKVIDFFEMESDHKDAMVTTIHYSLCEKFVTDPHDFELILQWASFASRYNYDYDFSRVEEMIVVVIARNYYYKWLDRFPENTRNSENQMLQDFFGSTKKAILFINKIENIFMHSLFMKVILN